MGPAEPAVEVGVPETAVSAPVCAAMEKTSTRPCPELNNSLPSALALVNLPTGGAFELADVFASPPLVWSMEYTSKPLLDRFGSKRKCPEPSTAMLLSLRTGKAIGLPGTRDSAPVLGLTAKPHRPGRPISSPAAWASTLST